MFFAWLLKKSMYRPLLSSAHFLNILILVFVMQTDGDFTILHFYWILDHCAVQPRSWDDNGLFAFLATSNHTVNWWGDQPEYINST